MGVGADDVLGEVNRLARREQTGARLDLVGLEQRIADRLALGGEEREAHRAADDERVDDVEQRIDHTELVCGLKLSFVQGLADGVGCDVTACLVPERGLFCVKARVS